MGDNRTDLPEGTDTIIDGALDTDDTGPETGAVTTETSLVTDTNVSANRGNSDFRQRIRDGGEKLTNEATDRARGLLGQGLERSAEALSNVSKLVGDTAQGLDERLGEEYGDYARRAASAIENTANTIASKNPDEIIEDTRDFVRNSPGLAVAGAAIVGFVVARLIKSGLNRNEDDDS
jgi:ElaB/YqjD/DUF883 family membrane-anchored ribosome-binding protein